MPTLSLRIGDKEFNLIKEYSKSNNIKMSSFVRDLIIDKLYEDIDPNEEKRIYDLWQESKKEKTYPADLVFKELGI